MSCVYLGVVHNRINTNTSSMISSYTTSEYRNLKGFLAELICEYHFKKLNYNVIPLGNEKVSGLLPTIDNVLKNTEIVKEGTYDKNTFDTLKNLTQFLPDFALWKLTNNYLSSDKIAKQNILKVSYVEVKYRYSIDSSTFAIKENIDPLNLWNYVTFMENKAKEQDASINEIDFYVYLITFDKESNHHKIKFGKILNTHKRDEYILTVYDGVNEKFNQQTGCKWNDFNKILDFLLIQNAVKIDRLFDDNYILSQKNEDEFNIRESVFSKLNEYQVQYAQH